MAPGLLQFQNGCWGVLRAKRLPPVHLWGRSLNGGTTPFCSSFRIGAKNKPQCKGEMPSTEALDPQKWSRACLDPFSCFFLAHISPALSLTWNAFCLPSPHTPSSPLVYGSHGLQCGNERHSSLALAQQLLHCAISDGGPAVGLTAIPYNTFMTPSHSLVQSLKD